MDQLLHNPPRPEAKVKAILPRVSSQNPALDLLLLPARQLGFRPLRDGLRQRLPTLILEFMQPRVDGGAAQAKAFHDFAGTLAIFNDTPNRLDTNMFERLVIERASVNNCQVSSGVGAWRIWAGRLARSAWTFFNSAPRASL